MVSSVFLYYLLLGVYSLLIERIPSTATPPEARSLCIMETFEDLNVTLVFGGYSDPRNAFNDLWSFDLQRNIWSRLSASDGIYPVSRYNGGSFISSNDFYLYIFGGMSISGPLNDLWKFQVEGFLWTQIATSGDVPTPRLKFGYCAFTQNNILKFAVFGGLTMKGDDNSLFLLDTSTWIWEKLAQNGDIPPPIEGASLIYYNNCLFIAGGEAANTTNPHLQTFYLYDLSNNQWKNITSSNTYSSRIFHGSLLYNEEIYLLHGYSNLLKKNNQEWYKVNLLDSKYEWSQVQVNNMTNEVLLVNSYGYTLYNSNILVFGGNQNPPVINQLVVFDLQISPVNYQIYDSYKSPSPRMYHSMQAMNHNLYYFNMIEYMLFY